ncbi:SMP-30/gluconolactonase/LRE family protein [Pseudonocardiaceae bacterium YIM PH 21723]|nr:SMP-30/gluconolactonase/LRE family protein [Pseudonocardiaceae bacterium YIM PH 21723]
MSGFSVVAEGLLFPEGPIALSDGSVIVCELQRGTLTSISPAGAATVIAETGGGPNGAAFGSDGAIYVANDGGFHFEMINGINAPLGQAADYSGGRIQRVTLDGKVEDLYTEVGGHPLRGPNDLVFDGHGGFYFTDSGNVRARDSDHGGLYYALEDGSAITEIAYPISGPNGVGLSPAGDRVYVAETMTGRLWYWDIESPGVLRPGSQFYAPAGGTLLHGLGGYLGFDSLKVDVDGNINVATLFGEGAVSTISPQGTLLRTTPVPTHDPCVTNIAFGGPDLRTAYITSGGRGLLYRADWPVAGLPTLYVP